MRVISKRKIREYLLEDSKAELPFAEWYYRMRACTAKNFNELKKFFNSIDVVGKYTIFDIAGNHYRLIAAIHYSSQSCYIRQIWRHAEYSKKTNQDKLNKGDL